MSVMSKEGMFSAEHAWKTHPCAYAKAVNLSRKLKHAYDAALAKYDLLVMPTTVTPANPLPTSDASPLEHMAKHTGKLENTSPFNASGHPALAMPIGFVPSKYDEKVKVPASMQIVGKYWDEVDVLKAAYAWEKARSWEDF